MTHKLIKTDNYLLVVDDSEIKEDDWYKTPLGIYSQFNGTEKLLEGTKRVAAHLPLNNSPILEGVALLPPIENVEYHWKSTLIIIDQNPTEFECEMESVRNPPPSRGFSVVPITVITAQGIQWVGKYM